MVQAKPDAAVGVQRQSSRISQPSGQQLEQLGANIYQMLEQAAPGLSFATEPYSVNQTQIEQFFKQTNAMYCALQSMFGHQSNYIHREVVARELTVQLGNRYPGLISSLKDCLEYECTQQIAWVDSQFDRMQKDMLTKFQRKEEALQYLDRETRETQARKDQTSMVNALKSFFKRAVQSEQEKSSSQRTQYDTFEQVTAQKFDYRIQVQFQLKGWSDERTNLDHPDYLTDSMKTAIVRQIGRQKQRLTALIENHPWPDSYNQRAQYQQQLQQPPATPSLQNPYFGNGGGAQPPLVVTNPYLTQPKTAKSQQALANPYRQELLDQQAQHQRAGEPKTQLKTQKTTTMTSASWHEISKIPFVSIGAMADPQQPSAIKSFEVLLDQLLTSDPSANYHRIVFTIGSQEARMNKLSQVFECFDPVWPKHTEWTRILMQRIARTLLPEMTTGTENEVVNSFVTNLLSQSYNTGQVRRIDRDQSLLSYELLILIFLTMLGFTLPVAENEQYNPRLDNQKAWSRELLLRVIKHHAPVKLKQYQYLVALESQTVKYLQAKYPQVCKFGIDKRQTSVNVFEALSELYHGENGERLQRLAEQSSVTLDQMINKRYKIVLENLYVPDMSSTSRHVFICVSGFLSETGEMETSWRYLIDECRQRGLPLYTVRWEAKDSSQLENIALSAAVENLAPVVKNTSSLSDLFSAQNLTSIGKFIGNSISDGKDTFKAARENAKITGKLLAHFLALGSDNQSPIFGDQTFSLLGFSLGSQVCKSAINRLKKLGQEKLIHNAYFMAGATYISREKQSMQKQTLIDVLSGQAYSLHTTNDEALLIFETIYGQKSIGRNAQFMKDRHNAANNLGTADQTAPATGQSELWFKWQNFDVGLLSKSHLDYRVKLDLILETINFQS